MGSSDGDGGGDNGSLFISTLSGVVGLYSSLRQGTGDLWQGIGRITKGWGDRFISLFA